MGAALAMLAAAPIAMINAVDRAVAFVMAWFAPEPRDVRCSEFDSEVAFTEFSPLDPALVNSLRHESGMRPLRC